MSSLKEYTGLVYIALLFILMVFLYDYKNPSVNADEMVISAMSVCYKTGTDDCYKNASEELYKKLGYKKLVLALETNQNVQEVFSRCHEVAHFVGRRAFEENPNIRDLYEHSSPACWGGFYHGVIESYFNVHPYKDPQEFVDRIKSVCGKVTDYSVPRLFSECTHGIGHGMMYVSDHDLLKSLKWCDELPDESSRTSCYGGVFMENSSSSTVTGSLHTSKYIKQDDPMYPCNILDKHYLNTCYQYQSSYFSQITHYDWDENAKLCLQVPEEYRSGCFMIIGSNQVGSTKNVEDMKNVCERMPNDFKKDCVGGVVSGLTGRYMENSKITTDFCQMISPDLREVCFRQFGGGVSSWGTNKSSLYKYCNLGNNEYRAWCESGLSGGSFVPIVN